MSNNAECTICTYINPDKGQTTKHNKFERFYSGTEQAEFTICLCRSHSNELFKKGQIKFLAKYWPVAKRFESKANKKMIKAMKNSMRFLSTSVAA